MRRRRPLTTKHRTEPLLAPGQKPRSKPGGQESPFDVLPNTLSLRPPLRQVDIDLGLVPQMVVDDGTHVHVGSMTVRCAGCFPEASEPLVAPP